MGKREDMTEQRNEWNRWFAWFPVRLFYEVNECPGFSYADSGNRAWLRYVERRRQWNCRPAQTCGGQVYGRVREWWEYRSTT